MALDKYTVYDLKYRLNKLKCCFAEKTAKLVDRQRYGKPCVDEKCNVQILGAYIEMLECLISEGCDCSAEWKSTIVAGADSELIWDKNVDYVKDQIVKVYPRALAVDTDEFLYMRWLGQLSTQSVQPAACNNLQCYPGQNDYVQGPGDLDEFDHPCWYLISQTGWSVCGNIKQAWQTRGQLTWTPGVLYQPGDIVKFMGGGNGIDQSGQNEFYIYGSKSNYTCGGNVFYFHENMVTNPNTEIQYPRWIKLACYDYQIV